MDVSIGLPNAVPGTTGAQLTEWARRAVELAEATQWRPLVAKALATRGAALQELHRRREALVAYRRAADIRDRVTKELTRRRANLEDEKRRIYAGMMSAMDDAVGQVFARLREKQLEENTLVFFISDNGGPTRELTYRRLVAEDGASGAQIVRAREADATP